MHITRKLWSAFFYHNLIKIYDLLVSSSSGDDSSPSSAIWTLAINVSVLKLRESPTALIPIVLNSEFKQRLIIIMG